MRGSEASPYQKLHWLRFIPARAGIGSRRWRDHRNNAVHPRSCGDRVNLTHKSETKGGSSPLVRGSALTPELDTGGQRFIPARAGIGHSKRALAVQMSVHPRSCGDRAAYVVGYSYPDGSSPLVRGSDSLSPQRCSVGRFIPARAGIGSSPGDAGLPLAVHPRSCGDRVIVISKQSIRRGSSPLVRGSVQAEDRELGKHRFIPARAGIGHDYRLPLCNIPVHPRSCGDRKTRNINTIFNIGSSPLVRGSVLL